MDTLRADRLGTYGNPSGLTPNLDRLAAQSIVFDDVYSQSNETVYSHASLFTSRYPTELAPLDASFRLPPQAETLPGVLRHYGYRTAAFVAGGHLDPRFGFAPQFDVFESPVHWGSLYHTAPLALRWLDSVAADRPAFVFVHGYDTHARYLKPPPFSLLAGAEPRGPGWEAALDPDGTLRVARGHLYPRVDQVEGVDSRFIRPGGAAAARWLEAQGGQAVPLTPRDAATLAAVYDGSVMYADTMFGLFLGGLAERGLLDRAWVVVLSDHGETLGEDGRYGHRHGLTDVELHVPLLVRPPGGRGGGRRVGGPTALLDVMPTLLDVAGARSPAGVRGRSFRGVLDGAKRERSPAVFSQGGVRLSSVRTAGGRLTFAGAQPGGPYTTELLRRCRLSGPAFTATGGLAGTAAEEARAALVDWHAGLSAPDPAAGVPLAPELLRTLQQRGYWTGSADPGAQGAR